MLGRLAHPEFAVAPHGGQQLAQIVTETAETIASKKRLYESCYSAEIERLRRQHGIGAVVEALDMLRDMAGRDIWEAIVMR
jgi:hypothetical protein